MNQSRRSFLKTSAAIGAAITGLSPKSVMAEDGISSEDRMGVLVDTTACIGCRKCEWACKKAHDLPAGNIDDYDDRSVFKTQRRPDAYALTVVNEYENHGSKFPLNVKFQCMHCDHPACASACIVGAFSKHKNGAVLWDTRKCIGCRYCMIACPFQVPAFEYDKAWNPDIKKCDFCFDRTKKGILPACVEICPMEVMIYGEKSRLLRVAREKIRLYPNRYSNNILGEHEVGGTSWMYLANRDFTKIGFPKLQNQPAASVTEALQHGLFTYFISPVALFTFLGGVMWLSKNKDNEEDEKKE